MQVQVPEMWKTARSIADLWNEWAKRKPAGVSPLQMLATKSAFFGGIRGALCLLQMLSEIEDETARDRLMAAVWKDIGQVRDEIIQEIVGTSFTEDPRMRDVVARLSRATCSCPACVAMRLHAEKQVKEPGK